MNAEDRRKEDIPVDKDRRLESRVAILETKIDNNESVIETTQVLLMNFLKKLDSHISEENSNTLDMSNNMVRVTTTVDNLTSEIKRTNVNLEKFVDKLEDTHTTVTEWDTIAKTLVKVCIVISVVIGSGWTLMEFIIQHKPDVSITK